MSAIRDIDQERQRQIEIEGWSLEHDDKYTRGQIAQAAAVYVSGATYQATIGDPNGALYGLHWPWDRAWLKWKDQRSNLVRAGALIVAEIERLDRLAEKVEEQ